MISNDKAVFKLARQFTHEVCRLLGHPPPPRARWKPRAVCVYTFLARPLVLRVRVHQVEITCLPDELPAFAPWLATYAPAYTARTAVRVPPPHPLTSAARGNYLWTKAAAAAYWPELERRAP
jgi:hypothetical protein